MKNLYLYLLKVSKPKLFFVIITFIVIQLFVTLLKIQIIPFFLFGMYSDVFHSQDIYEGIGIEIDGQPFDYMELVDIHTEMIVSPIRNYKAYIDNDSVDPFSKRIFFHPLITRIEENLPELYNKRKFKTILYRVTNDKYSINNFKYWLKRYLEASLDRKINNLKIYINSYTYKKERLVLVSSRKIIEID